MNLNSSVLRWTLGLMILIAGLFNNTSAQVTLKVGGGLGLLSPASDFGGSNLDYYNGTAYGLGSGLNLQGKVKVGFIGFNLTGEIDYASLNNNGNMDQGIGQIQTSQHVVSLKVGPEFHLPIPVLPISLYIGANLAMNSFGGDVTFQGVSKVPSGTYSIANATRIGAGISIGSELSLGPALTLDLNVAYNLMNLSGKAWNDANPAANQRIDSYLSLNDAPDPNYAPEDGVHIISADRSIHSTAVTLSVLFGI